MNYSVALTVIAGILTIISLQVYRIADSLGRIAKALEGDHAGHIMAHNVSVPPKPTTPPPPPR